MNIYLISHTTKNSKGSYAQATITARTSSKALQEFDVAYPERKATVIGIKGDEDGGVRLA